MYRFIRVAIIAIVLCSCTICLKAQVSEKDNEVYKETAAKLRSEIWGNELPNLKDYTIPEKYKGYSKVILANQRTLSVGDAIASKNALTRFLDVEHKLIKLNDALAVKAYSEFSLTQLEKTASIFYGYKYSKFLGVRIIKPDGKLQEVKSDEMVFTKDEKYERKAKLAIPDLLPGDVLDYYVATELKIDPKLIRTFPFLFDFYDAAPVLHQTLHCSIGKKFATEYRCYNGAPEFKTSKDAEDNAVFDLATDSTFLVGKNAIWVAPFRQAPFIELNVVRGDAVPYTPFTRRTPGDIIKDQDPEKIVRDAVIDLSFMKKEVLDMGYFTMRKSSDLIEAYYSALVKGGRLQEDSAAAELYYMFRFDFLFGHMFQTNAERLANFTKGDFNSFAYCFLMSEYFKRHGMKAEIALATSNHDVKMDQLMDKRDLLAMCNVSGAHDKMFGATSLYSPAFYVPAILENIPDAVAVDTKGDYDTYMATKFTQRRLPTPQSHCEDNVHKEVLSVMPDPEHDGVRVARTTSLTGHFRNSIQKELLLVEDFYDYERTFFGDKRSLEQRIDEVKPANGEELKAAFAAARVGQKESFLNEAKEWFNEEITDQQNLTIMSLGVRHTDPAFEYGSTFRVNGLLKHAGNNYLLEVGKLIGSVPEVRDAERDRMLDVYAPFAYRYKTELNIRVPEGYTIDGLEALNKMVKTDAGIFIVSAKLDGSIVNLDIENKLNSSYYPAKDWPKVLSILDAKSGWAGSKLLLRKKV